MMCTVVMLEGGDVLWFGTGSATLSNLLTPAAAVPVEEGVHVVAVVASETECRTDSVAVTASGATVRLKDA